MTDPGHTNKTTLEFRGEEKEKREREKVVHRRNKREKGKRISKSITEEEKKEKNKKKLSTNKNSLFWRESRIEYINRKKGEVFKKEGNDIILKKGKRPC